MADDHHWFDEVSPGSWSMTWPTGWVSDLAAALTTVMDRLRDPGREVWIVDASGDRYDHAELAGVAADSAETVMESMRQPTLRSDELAMLGASAGNLSLIASAAGHLDDLSSGAGSEQRELVAARDFFDQLARRVFRALDGGIRQLPDGRFALDWRDGDRTMITTLATDFDQLVAGDDPSIVRLFPPAYGGDDERSSGYAAMTRDDLIERRRASAATLLAAIDADSIDGDQLVVVMRALNDLRLVLGTELDVSEDHHPRVRPSDPDAPRWAAYERLTALLGQVIDVLGRN